MTPVPSPFRPRVRGEAKLHLWKRAQALQARRRPSRGSPCTRVGRRGRGAARGGRPRLEGAKPGFTRCLSAPTKAHEGPLVGTLKNSPVMVHFPEPGPRAPATPSALRPEGTPRPPAASRLSSRPTEFLETRRFLVLPGRTWWRSVSQGPQKVKLPQDPCSPQSHPTIAWTSSFSCNVSRPCGYLAKFLFYRTMAASVSCQESDQDPVRWETSRHLCVANTDSKPHPGGDPGPFTASTGPNAGTVESADQLWDKLRASGGRERANGASSPRRQNIWVDRGRSTPSPGPGQGPPPVHQDGRASQGGRD